MSHHDLWDWTDLETLASRCSVQIKTGLLSAHEYYLSWLVFQAGRSDETINSEEMWDLVDIILVRVALEKAEELYNFANQEASPIQADRLTAFRGLGFSFGKNPMVAEVRPLIRALRNALVAGDEAWAEFKSFQGGDSDAQSAVQLNISDATNTATEALVNDARVALRSCNQMFEFANDAASFGGPRDRLEDWRKLT
jgi:hypothetical protein